MSYPILWHSNAPWSPTGYGQQTGEWVPRLVDEGFDAAISAFYGLHGSSIVDDGVRIYPAGADPYGNDVLSAWAHHHFGGRPGLVWTLIDVWVLSAPSLTRMPVASWVPVDHDPLPPAVARYFAWSGARPVAMSRFGERKLVEAGFDPLYVPHSIPDGLAPVDRDEARRALGLPRDAAVLGMVAANKGTAPARKAFPEVLEAFALTISRGWDAWLYLHTDRVGPAGLDLAALADRIGRRHGVDIVSRIVAPDPITMRVGMPHESLSVVYSAFDALVNPSYGEGFGIPIVEAQACGVPVIVADNSSMPELVGDGVAVACDPFYDGNQDSWYGRPDVEALAGAMADYVAAPQGSSTEAMSFADEYRTKRILTEHMLPVLAELDPTVERDVVTVDSLRGRR